MNDLDVESGIPDFVVRSESAKNDLFSKFRLHSLWVGGWPGRCLDQMEIRLTSASVEIEVELS